MMAALKENVIIGHLNAAGTGINRYKDIEIQAVDDDDEENVPGVEEEIKSA